MSSRFHGINSMYGAYGTNGIMQYTIYYRVVVCVGSKMGSIIYHYHDCTRSISSEQDNAHLDINSIIILYP